MYGLYSFIRKKETREKLSSIGEAWVAGEAEGFTYHRVFIYMEMENDWRNNK